MRAQALSHANSNKQQYNGQQRWRWQSAMILSPGLLLLLLLLVIAHCRCIAPRRTPYLNERARGILCLAAASLPLLINKLQYFPIFPCNGAYDCYLIIITAYTHTMTARHAIKARMCVREYGCVHFIIASKLCKSSLRKSLSEMKQ